MGLAIGAVGHFVLSKKEIRERILVEEIKEVSKRLGCPIVGESNDVLVMDC